MNDLQKMEQKKSVLRWGGLAGILGGIIFILTFVTRIAFVGPDYVDPEGVVMFPDVRAALTVENSLYLVSLILWVTLFLALYRALRGTSLAPALGSVLGVMGLAMLAVGSLVYVATAHVSDLYHAPGATPEDQATLVLLWLATYGIFEALLAVGFLLLQIGVIVLGVAMIGAPAFGKGFGGASVVLGVVGVVATSTMLVVSSPIVAVGVLALIVFHLVLGWKVYSLSRTA